MALSIDLTSCTFFFFLLLLVPSQGDTTSFAFDSFDTNSPVLTYQGDAKVTKYPALVRLTRTDKAINPQKYSVGRVVYSQPVSFWEPGKQASFETTISFRLTPVSAAPADGIVFFIAPVGYPIPEGSTGGSFGLFDNNTGLAPSRSVFAVEFDTFFQGNNAEWDPDFRHIGIGINSRVSRNVTVFQNPLRKVVTAHISYVSSTRKITVVAISGSQTSTVSYVFDLKTILPQQVQVGISATTGGEVAVHDLLSWCFTSTMVWEDSSYSRQYV